MMWLLLQGGDDYTDCAGRSGSLQGLQALRCVLCGQVRCELQGRWASNLKEPTLITAMMQTVWLAVEVGAFPLGRCELEAG